MLDFVVSQAGQQAFGEGGLTPYREDVKAEGKVRFTYQSIQNDAKANPFLVKYDDEFLKGKPAFEQLWKQVTGR